MADRFLDGLLKASSRAEEMVKSEVPERPRIFTDFLNAVKVSAGSAHQLAMNRCDPQWLDLRDVLEKVLEVGEKIPLAGNGPEQNFLWVGIQKSLLIMRDNGKRLLNAKGISRTDALAMIDLREQKARISPEPKVEVNG